MPQLETGRFRARKLAHRYNNHFPDSCDSMDALVADREQILRQLFGKVGTGVYMEPPLFVDYGCNISVGDGVYANPKYVFFSLLFFSFPFLNPSGSGLGVVRVPLFFLRSSWFPCH